MKRPALAPAIAVFVLGLMICGLVLIVMDQVFQFFTATGLVLCSSGCYDAGNMGFFQDVWTYAGLILVLLPLSIWLFLRAQESGEGQPG